MENFQQLSARSGGRRGDMLGSFPLRLVAILTTPLPLPVGSREGANFLCGS
jgi:hypothetical protein